MVRHELKDGKWYLIRFNDDDYKYSLGVFIDDEEFSDKAFFTLNSDSIYLEFVLNDNVDWVEIDPELVFELFSYKIKLSKNVEEKKFFDCLLNIRKGFGNRPTRFLDNATAKQLRLILRNEFSMHCSVGQVRAIREKIRFKANGGSLSDYLNMINIGSLPYPYGDKDETR